tara:strand:+ start:11074 stop:12150 length:1077 start_codon:yes stop_codon:yes gene_type:complete
MQTRTYGDLFNLVKSLAGVNAFTTEEQADISRFINRRYFQAYNMSQNWVRYLVPSEERFFQPRYYDITFNASGNALAPASSSITKKFFWIGMYNGSPAYSTIDELEAGVSGTYFLWKDAGVYDGDFVLSKARLNFSSGDVYRVANPITNEISSIIRVGGVLYQSIDINGDDNIADVTKEVPYAHLGEWKDNDLNVPVEGNLVFKGHDFIIPFNENLRSATMQKDVIGDFLRIHRKQALVNESSLEYDFYVDEEGAHILNVGNASDNHAFVTYKHTFTPFTTSSNYLTSTEKVPEEFFAFIAHATYADFLRMDGQHQKAIVEEGIGKDSLDLQLERNDIISNSNNATRKFSTYINRQSR